MASRYDNMDTRKIINELYLQAQSLNVCDRFRGNESIAELCKLMLTPQGVEFCLRNKYPSMTTLRELKPLGLQQYGIYIDAGEVVIDNPERVALIGKTSATVNIDNHGRHRIVGMRGANITINARNWAVVVVKNDPTCHLMKNQFDHSIIL